MFINPKTFAPISAQLVSQKTSLDLCPSVIYGLETHKGNMKVVQRLTGSDLYVSVCLDNSSEWGNYIKRLVKRLPEGTAILKQSEKDLHLVTQID